MNPREGLSGGSPEAAGDAAGSRQGGQEAARAEDSADSGVSAGQGRFMSDSGEPHESLSGNGVSNTPSPTSVRRDGEGEVDGAVEGEDQKAPAKPAREDVERLCVHLADRIEGNGSNRPTITQKWRDSARLMLDNDHRTEDQVRTAIDWCQDDEFWRINIQSMPKLREQYEKLRLAALKDQRGRGTPGRTSGPKQANYSDEEYTRGWG